MDRRLSTTSPSPVAVAFSGGGDSLALLLTTLDWAERHGRRVLALSLDHGLQPQSAAWTQACSERALKAGAAFRALTWDGPKPPSGLPAAARGARHALLAEAAREAGASVLLMGHTADDIAEARLMRERGARLGEPQEWSASPAWPQGRGVFVLRPMLSVRRAEIRDWLAAHGEAWIDDPANDDLHYARSRARRALAAGATAPAAGAFSLHDAAALAELCTSSPLGELSIPRLALRSAPFEAAHAFVAAACLCAAGGAAPARRERSERLTHALLGEAPVRATLAGARCVAGAEVARFSREPGETARGGLAPIGLTAGAGVVWDGRYEIPVSSPGMTVRSLVGLAASLPNAERRALARVPASLRGALPALHGPQGVSCPLLAAEPAVEVQTLALTRLQAALGAVQGEV
ncbi:MAG: tRNA lysidine(34) synthetase TilS [Phenylobacterium sp.]|nr:tRNA lysidine(34) synthetase TilS [Phenylobacterium sp.]MDP3659763.1 tRNA lysidine(34) synthetase TilS [Phenylobacterium sp.]